MARPNTSPRLASVTPSSVAQRVVQLAAIRTTLARPEHHTDVPLGRDAELLTRYALGEKLPDDARPCDLLHRVSLGVYGVEPKDMPSELGSEVNLVLLAARARQKLDATPSLPLTTSEFSAVVGMDPSTARRLMRAGDLKSPGRGLVDPEAARRAMEEARVPRAEAATASTAVTG